MLTSILGGLVLLMFALFWFGDRLMAYWAVQAGRSVRLRSSWRLGPITYESDVQIDTDNRPQS